MKHQNDLKDWICTGKCPRCREPQALIRRIILGEEGFELLGCLAYVCVNKKCILRINMENVPTWKRIRKTAKVLEMLYS